MSNYGEEAKIAYQQMAESLTKLTDTVDWDVAGQVAELLIQVKENGRKVLVAGCGTSGVAAKKIAHIMNVIMVPCFFLSPTGAVHGDLGAVQKDDVVILITKGGQTQALLDYVGPTKYAGAKLIAVTEEPGSELAKSSDIVLKIRVDRESDPWGMVATTSTIAVMAVWDAILIAVKAHNGLTKEDLLRIHSGGAVGAKLSGELSE